MTAHCCTTTSIRGQRSSPSLLVCCVFPSWVSVWRRTDKTLGWAFAKNTDDRQTATNQTCGAALVNNSPDTVTYNFFTFGGTTQWLNGNCIMQNGVAGGKCIFQDDAQNDPPPPDIYVAFVVPFFLLTSET